MQHDGSSWCALCCLHQERGEKAAHVEVEVAPGKGHGRTPDLRDTGGQQVIQRITLRAVGLPVVWGEAAHPTFVRHRLPPFILAQSPLNLIRQNTWREAGPSQD